jgi:hypothetical protein
MRSLVATLSLAAAVACSDRGAPPPPEPQPRDRPLAQDGSVARGVTSTPDRARVQLDLAAVRGALRSYHAEHATWPRALADLSLEGTLNYPADLAYDPATGTVTSRTYPSY